MFFFLLNIWNRSRFCWNTLFHTNVHPSTVLSHILSDAQHRLAHLYACKHPGTKGCLAIIKNIADWKVAYFLASFFGWVRNASMDRRWHLYWLMKYIKILGHNCKCLKHCSIYEQHSVICVQVIYKNINIYHMGDKCCLTESPYPKFDNSAQYYIHIWFMK